MIKIILNLVKSSALIVFILGCYFISIAHAHVTDQNFIVNLKGATMLLQRALNDPPTGYALMMIETKEGKKIVSEREFEQLERRLLKEKPVGFKIRVGYIYTRAYLKDPSGKLDERSYELDEDININPSRILKSIQVESVGVYPNESEVHFSTTPIGEITKVVKDKDGVDRTFTLAIKIHFHLYDEIIGTEKYIDDNDSENPDGSLKYKTKKSFIQDGHQGYIIKDIIRFLDGIFYFDLGSIPRIDL